MRSIPDGTKIWALGDVSYIKFKNGDSIDALPGDEFQEVNNTYVLISRENKPVFVFKQEDIQIIAYHLPGESK